MSSGVEFVVAAYEVIWVILVLYVVSMGLRTARPAREAELLARLLDERDRAAADDDRNSVPAPDEAARVGH
jgi:CcmD family protein